MTSIEEIRDWLRGKSVRGLPDRTNWGKSDKDLLAKPKRKSRIIKPHHLANIKESDPDCDVDDPKVIEEDLVDALEEVEEANAVVEEALEDYEEKSFTGSATSRGRSRKKYKTSGRYKINKDKTDALLLFGKNNGKRISELAKKESSYLDWIQRQEFPDDLKEVIKHQKSLLTSIFYEEDDDEEEVEEEDFYKIQMINVESSQRINVIKTIRTEIHRYGLKETKDMTDDKNLPFTFPIRFTAKHAKKIVRLLERAGAIVQLHSEKELEEIEDDIEKLFKVEVLSYEFAKKIAPIKALRTIAQEYDSPLYGLKKAKHFIENLPKTIGIDFTIKEAERAAKLLDEAGAKIRLHRIA